MKYFLLGFVFVPSLSFAAETEPADYSRPLTAASSAEFQSRDDVNSRDDDEDGNQSFFNRRPHFRAAARLGVDSTRVDVRRDYVSGGAELALINTDYYLRPEIGVKGSMSINGVQIGGEKVNRISNAYGFFGLGGTYWGLVGGARLLLGHEWIDIADDVARQDNTAIGGEGRIGYEFNRGMSVFASYAITKHLQMVGIDFGISL